jgi:hypothetical protein
MRDYTERARAWLNDPQVGLTPLEQSLAALLAEVAGEARREAFEDAAELTQESAIRALVEGGKP